MAINMTCFSYDEESGLSEFHRYGKDAYGLHQTHEGATNDPIEVAAMCAQRFPPNAIPSKFRVLLATKALNKQHERYYK